MKIDGEDDLFSELGWCYAGEVEERRELSSLRRHAWDRTRTGLVQGIRQAEPIWHWVLMIPRLYVCMRMFCELIL